ncbi:tellurite resistance TerB family protein [Arenibaculum pallidiluteum]|uniref:tellurite resistance TerB family protein n=1 Tax=Arenibaculum pallidiluteum TaxID=2812559 RepID=UPI001A95D79A|nr:tellurite resistance TerB family protein [Arenibaculum pallidiluteum]
MADLTRLLGSMLATGMAGRSHRGGGFARAPFGGSGAGVLGGLGGLGGIAGAAAGLGAARAATGGDSRKALGLAALGYLAYKTYQDVQAQRASQPAQGAATPSTGPSAERPAEAGGPSLGERLGALLGGGPKEPTAYPEAQIGDAKALLLIRAMVAAANADGRIDEGERRRILDHLDRAGAGPDEHQVLEQELRRPVAIDQLVAQVDGPETAEQVYLASTLAIEADSAAERSYLQFLAARLGLPEDRAEALRHVA